MAEPHPLYIYGPVLFVGISFVASAALTPYLRRVAERRWGPYRNAHKVRLVCLLASIATFWVVGTALGLALLIVPIGESAHGLPGERLDAVIVAHMVPTVAPLACDRIVERLEAEDAPSRWDPSARREAKLVLAARVDDDSDRAIERLVRNGFRTHAGRFALSKPTARACELGLEALAEAHQGGALRDLMTACHEAPGDGIGRAAFKMGDFMAAGGPESEAIVTRQLLTPLGEPTCFAQGPDLPDPQLSMCRLQHAELHLGTRAAALEGLSLEAPFARRWLTAIRAEDGAPLATDATFTIDPITLVERPFLAVLDEPIAVYEDIREDARGALTPGASAWVRIAIAAERSAASRHEDAAKLVDEAIEQLDLGAGATFEERAKVRRLAAAIAMRAGDGSRFEGYAEDLDVDDPLLGLAFGELETPDRPWIAALDRGGTSLAAALDASAASVVRGGLWRLSRLAEDDRGPVRDWLREAFPPCDRCGFFAMLDRLAVRLDAARATGDEPLVIALETVLSRFEAVFLNRALALSLRSADPAPTLPTR